MIGTQYNPDNCTFISNQALNANQFNDAVPNAVNDSTYLLLWDFVAEKLYWVNSLTNIIEHELPSAAGGVQNEVYIVKTNLNEEFNLTVVPQVFNNNYIVLPAGTYMFDLEYDYVLNDSNGAFIGIGLFEIRTNANPAVTSADASDVIVKQRQTKVGDFDRPAIINQTIKTEAVTFNSSFIVKSSGSTTLSPTTSRVKNFWLRAFKIK